MKKPEEIKKGLECCRGINAPCEGCPYNMEKLDYDESVSKLHDDALAYIQQLEAGIEEWEYVAASPGAVEDMAREIAWLKKQLGQAAKHNQQLEKKLATQGGQFADQLRDLMKKNERLIKERDAAVSEIGTNCETCKHYAACHSSVQAKITTNFCNECEYWSDERYVCCWEWRGVCEENSGKAD